MNIYPLFPFYGNDAQLLSLFLLIEIGLICSGPPLSFFHDNFTFLRIIIKPVCFSLVTAIPQSLYFTLVMATSEPSCNNPGTQCQGALASLSKFQWVWIY